METVIKTEASAAQRTASAWCRLQALSCAHARTLNPGPYGKRIGVPEVIRENVAILGRADESELKARVLWYMDIHPGLFRTMCDTGWKY